MPTPITTIIEPVSVLEFKEHARIHTNQEEFTIGLNISAAREKCESFCNRNWVSKTVTKTYTIDKVAPIDADTFISVNGQYSTLLEVLNTYNYYVEYVKGISVNRQYPVDTDNLPTYTITYNEIVNPADVPSSVKKAILLLASHFYENREATSDVTIKEIAMGYRELLHPYRTASCK